MYWYALIFKYSLQISEVLFSTLPLNSKVVVVIQFEFFVEEAAMLSYSYNNYNNVFSPIQLSLPVYLPFLLLEWYIRIY